eukprot:787824-Amorphochlora_amoeboformis.AAC.1
MNAQLSGCDQTYMINSDLDIKTTTFSETLTLTNTPTRNHSTLPTPRSAVIPNSTIAPPSGGVNGVLGLRHAE